MFSNIKFHFLFNPNNIQLFCEFIVIFYIQYLLIKIIFNKNKDEEQFSKMTTTNFLSLEQLQNKDIDNKLKKQLLEKNIDDDIFQDELNKIKFKRLKLNSFLKKIEDFVKKINLNKKLKDIFYSLFYSDNLLKSLRNKKFNKFVHKIIILKKQFYIKNNKQNNKLIELKKVKKLNIKNNINYLNQTIEKQKILLKTVQKVGNYLNNSLLFKTYYNKKKIKKVVKKINNKFKIKVLNKNFKINSINNAKSFNSKNNKKSSENKAIKLEYLSI